MKISKVLFLAMVALISLAVFSCGDDGGLGTPGVASVGSLPALPPGHTPAAEKKDGINEYLDLLGNALGSNRFTSMLDTAYSAALAAQLRTENITYPTTSSGTTYSYNIKINDTTELKTAAEVAAATLSGNVSRKDTVSRPELWGYSVTPKDGDKTSSSTSGKITYNITPNYYKLPNNYSTKDYYISGIITVESKGSQTQTTKDAVKLEYETSESSTDKVSITVAIYSQLKASPNTVVGAKFTLSGASTYSSKERSASQSGEGVCSDIIVYYDNGKEYDRITGDAAETYLSKFLSSY